MSTTFCHFSSGRSSGSAASDAGVVQKNVDLAEGRDGLVDDRLHVRGFRDVAQHAFDAKALRAHLGDGRRQPFLAPCAQHQRGARFGESFRHLLPDAARSTGDNRHAAVKCE
jgi:hypothetical protein